MATKPMLLQCPAKVIASIGLKHQPMIDWRTRPVLDGSSAAVTDFAAATAVPASRTLVAKKSRRFTTAPRQEMVCAEWLRIGQRAQAFKPLIVDRA
jgi:hypothetical protein